MSASHSSRNPLEHDHELNPCHSSTSFASAGLSFFGRIMRSPISMSKVVATAIMTTAEKRCWMIRGGHCTPRTHRDSNPGRFTIFQTDPPGDEAGSDEFRQQSKNNQENDRYRDVPQCRKVKMQTYRSEEHGSEISIFKLTHTDCTLLKRGLYPVESP